MCVSVCVFCPSSVGVRFIRSVQHCNGVVVEVPPGQDDTRTVTRMVTIPHTHSTHRHTFKHFTKWQYHRLFMLVPRVQCGGCGVDDFYFP